MIRIKNWTKFQHFKDRKPPWVKLYRDILDDMEWHRLDAKAAKALVMLWLIASESDGVLPDVETLAFRLRTSETEISSLLSKLSHWLEQDDIAAISRRHQPDGLEAEKRREEKEKRASDFSKFWTAYPRKEAKKDAESAWQQVQEPVETLLTAIERQRNTEKWTKAGGQFIPLPATYLRGKRWEDLPVSIEAPAPSGPDPALEKIKADAARAAPMPHAIREQFAVLKGKTYQ